MESLVIVCLVVMCLAAGYLASILGRAVQLLEHIANAITNAPVIDNMPQGIGAGMYFPNLDKETGRGPLIPNVPQDPLSSGKVMASLNPRK